MLRHSLFLGCLLVLGGCQTDRRDVTVREGSTLLPDGTTLYYQVMGSGPDTVFVLAGGPAWSSSYLRDPFTSLARDHAIILPDLRGRGRSSPVIDSSGASLQQDLADLAAFDSLLGPGPVTVAGHGYGAGLAAMYALRRPDRVSNLILISPMFTHVNLVWQASFWPNDSVATGRYLAAKRLGRDTVDPAGFCREFWGFALSPVEQTDAEIVSRLAPHLCDVPSANLRRMDLVGRRVRRSLGSWDWRDSLPLIQVPTLIVQGGGDLFLQRTAEIWSELLPHATMKLLSAPPHFPWIGDPPAFDQSLQEFLHRPPVTAARASQRTRDKVVTAAPR